MTYPQVYQHPKNKALRNAIGRVEKWLEPYYTVDYLEMESKDREHLDKLFALSIRLEERMYKKYYKEQL